MPLRPNPVKESIARRGRSIGTMVFEFFTPSMPALLATTGAEFAIYDMEHSGASVETIRTVLAASRGPLPVPLVRVPATEYHFLARVLDSGALGLMVPMVESKSQAEAIVESTTYPPHGRRGAAFGFAHDDYERGDLTEKVGALNARRLLIAQIESERGLAHLEEIAAVPGIDVLWVGHFDLTNFLGIPRAVRPPGVPRRDGSGGSRGDGAQRDSRHQCRRRGDLRAMAPPRLQDHRVLRRFSPADGRTARWDRKGSRPRLEQAGVRARSNLPTPRVPAAAGEDTGLPARGPRLP